MADSAAEYHPTTGACRNARSCDARTTVYCGLDASGKSDANDTRAIIQRLVEIRAQQATLLGFPHYAAWKIADQMAKTPEAALNFMRKLFQRRVNVRAMN